MSESPYGTETLGSARRIDCQAEREKNLCLTEKALAVYSVREKDFSFTENALKITVWSLKCNNS